eukprot:2145045-Amphidinium_carterae.1
MPQCNWQNHPTLESCPTIKKVVSDCVAKLLVLLSSRSGAASTIAKLNPLLANYENNLITSTSVARQAGMVALLLAINGCSASELISQGCHDEGAMEKLSELMRCPYFQQKHIKDGAKTF